MRECAHLRICSSLLCSMVRFGLVFLLCAALVCFALACFAFVVQSALVAAVWLGRLALAFVCRHVGQEKVRAPRSRGSSQIPGVFVGSGCPKTKSR